MSQGGQVLKYRIGLLISLAVVTPLGFASKFYRGPLAWWFNDYLGGLLYEVFWILVVFLLLPQARPQRVAGIVFLVTSALEFLQLWHPPFLQAVRATFLGRTLIGNYFTWWDFPYYLIGCVLGALWGLYLQGRLGGRPEATQAKEWFREKRARRP